MERLDVLLHFYIKSITHVESVLIKKILLSTFVLNKRETIVFLGVTYEAFLFDILIIILYLDYF